MPVVADICARAGEYQDPNTGETKVRWKNCGIKIVKDDKEYIKLDCYPLPNAEGEVFLAVFPKKPKAQAGGFRVKPDETPPF